MKLSNTSVQIKIISLIILILFITITSIVYITVRNQKTELLDSAKNTLSINTDLLSNTIKGIMLSGEAPIAVRTIQNIKSIPELQVVDLYRTNGEVAFSDYTTLDFVNEYQDRVMFNKTDRSDDYMADNPYFKEALDFQRPVNIELKESGHMEYYFPIRNERECWDCHGPSSQTGPIRGIAHFQISIQGIYTKIRQARNFLILLFAITGILLAGILIMFLRSIIVKPLKEISGTVNRFGEGELDVQVHLPVKDEFGKLGDQLNDMFLRIKERIELSKFVSKSTNEMIRLGGSAEGGKKMVTALFSDIRGFTQFADTHDPAEVVRRLNRILNVQAELVDTHGGDVDKFVGDEVMAIFPDPYFAVRAAYDMILAVQKLNEGEDDHLFVGIGINTGEVIAGNIGSANRKEFAVIGDPINLASRLCSAAKANMILISESTHESVQNVVDAREVKDQKVKGKSGSVNFYVVHDVHKQDYEKKDNS